MAFTLSQLLIKRDALVAAIAGGYTELSAGDKTIRYQSIDQMRSALAMLESEIAAVSTETPKVRQIRLYCTKGL